jgi:predicted ArsR family transcriptional regulator
MTDILRAVTDPTRRRILSYIEIRDEAVTVDEVAAAHGLHRTVAFDHLELLAELGLLARRDRPGSRGRPARTYRLSGYAVEASYPPRQYRLLASLLAAAGMSKTAARRAGEGHGRRLAGGTTSDAEAIGRLEPLGARYELHPGGIRARNCVFAEACAEARAVVCELQAGLLLGALAAAGSERAVIAQGPDGRGGCEYRVAVA